MRNFSLTPTGFFPRPSDGAPAQLRQSGKTVIARGTSYRWTWPAGTDEVVLEDAEGRGVLSHRLQPTVLVAGGARPAPGRCIAADVDGSTLHVRYEGVNGYGAISLRLRFLAGYYILDEVVYEPAGEEAIVRLAYFGSAADDGIEPDGVADVCVVPGGRQDPEQALFRTRELEGVRFSIGCFGMGTGTFHQQWALPHYQVACYNQAPDGGTASGAACIGLGSVPDGNVSVVVDRGRFAYEINFRGDLWGHRRGPAAQRFDFPFVTAVAPDWYRAGVVYLHALLAEGYAQAKERGDVPEAAFWPQYDTWGDQAARRCILHLFNEEHLRDIYHDFRASGLAARLFVIDDKWEGIYGSMEHHPVRFPRFRELLEEIRADGYEIGLWTAFPRCEDYHALGLTEEAVLVRPDGTPYLERQGNRQWYVFDPTNPQAAAYLAERARHLVRTYRPALVKIDFGYEIPTPDNAAPHDPAQGGERLFQRFLEVVVGALKEVNPNVAILYYCLTPLFNDYLDQCGMDDLWMSRGAYDAGFARRALLAAWCGATGLVPYGSSGYDWRSASDIWFDTAVIGTPGIIAPLVGDEYDERPTPELVARYNGIARVARSEPRFQVELLDADLSDPQAGPRARSWARVERGGVVVAALRPAEGGTVAVPGLVETDHPVVVASLTSEGIGSSLRLGLVPFGSGRVSIRCGERCDPRATARLLGGETVPVEAPLDGEWLVVPVAPSTPDGVPVETIEVSFNDHTAH